MRFSAPERRSLSGDFRDQPRPPLTVDLFDEGSYRAVLGRYGLAHQAGRVITAERADNDALALEQVLHNLRVSEYPHHRHMALAVPPYLQHLLHWISDKLYTDVFRYDRLVDRLLRLPYVMFLTLNYDVLLDRRLNDHRLLSTLGDYIASGENWSLIKAHGSVNWFHPVSVPFQPELPPADLEWNAERFECVAPNADLAYLRGGGGGATSRYPALALPEGPDDELVLPREHVAYVNTRLRGAEVDLLVIGYSGLDKEVLSLLEQVDNVRRMTIVDRNEVEAQGVSDRFREAGIEAGAVDVVNGDFATWTDGGGLNQLVAEYSEA